MGGWTGRCALNDRPQIRLFAVSVTVSQLPTRATRIIIHKESVVKFIFGKNKFHIERRDESLHMYM